VRGCPSYLGERCTVRKVPTIIVYGYGHGRYMIFLLASIDHSLIKMAKMIKQRQ